MINTAYSFKQEVLITKGFYRGYKALVMEARETITEDTKEEIIEYLLKIHEVNTKEPQWIKEQDLRKYKKYILF